MGDPQLSFPLRPPRARLVFPAGSQPVATSEDAADALSAEELSARRLRVLRLFANADDGLTADEVVRACGGTPNSWAPRCTELLQIGLLERTAQRRRTRQGGSAAVLVITSRGRRHLGEP